MKISDISGQLSGKKKTVTDLARVIKNRNDDNPNYTLLLGAGCSITSGIRSASELIKEWRSEVCLEKNFSGTEVSEQIDYLKKNESDWYDSTKEYSSLFERKYDLQRQRRIFVEKEVANKTPSLGYAYLTSLVNQTFFNTVFTTNFDDLVNEAFYFYSDQRPIVCAHDSSINSITVTSKRPKVIKLHGDYLFDDIKATSRETESLEQNMKLKFIEFAKDYGLIVVGYSGCDRSIMDILTTLLKNDTYFKHGIYWCLRKDSEISEELKKLLWKDKVYFVEVDGFDELFAEIYSYKNNESELPISTLSITRKPSEMVGNLLNSEWLKTTNSPVLKSAYDSLKKQHTKSNLVSLILNMNKDSDSDIDSNDSDLISMIEMQQTYESQKFNEVIEKGKFLLQKNTSKSFKKRIINLLINAYRATNSVNEAIKLVDDLITEDRFNSSNYLLKSDIEYDSNRKLAILNDALKLNPYNVAVITKIIELKVQQKNVAFGEKKINLIKEIRELIDNSLKIDPSLDNPGWNEFYDLEGDSGDTESIRRKRSEIIFKIREMNPNSLMVFNFQVANLNADKDLDKFRNLLLEMEEQRKISTENKSINLLEIIVRGLIKFNLANDLLKYLEEVSNIKKICDYPDLVIQFVKAKRQIFGEDVEAIELLCQCLSKDFDTDIFATLFMAYIESKEIEKAATILEKYKLHISPILTFDYKNSLLEAQGDYDGALSELYKKKNLTSLLEHNTYIYLLIKKERYAEAKQFGKDILEPANYSTEDPVLIVNYELARKKLNESPSDKRLNDVLSQNSNEERVKSAVYAILGRKAEMLESIRKSLRKDKTFKYELAKWPVFDQFRQDKEFTSIAT